MGTRGARAAKADGGKPAQSATTTPGGKHVRGATPPAPARRKKPCLDLVSLVVSLWYFAVVAITTAVLMYASRNGIACDAYFAMVVARMPLLVGTLWLVFRRMRTARLAIVVVSAVGLAMTLADIATGAYALSESVWQLALPVALALYYLAAPWPRCVFTELLDLAPVARPDIPSWRQLFFRHSTWPGCRWLSRGRLRALTGESAHRRAGPRAVPCCHRTGLRRPASPRT